jgi:hypothetical protein
MLAESIAHWAALAEEQERSIAEGWTLVPAAARARAETYRRTAKALQHEADTGVALCVCCLKPIGDGRNRH